MTNFRATILGSGTSQGVPVIACNCHVCTSADPKDNRLRCSVLLETEDGNFVIDSGPDFRQQMLKHKVQSLKGVLFTHEHKDHVAGLDDVRAFNFKENRDMDVFCTREVEAALRREFHYVFQDNPYPGIPRLQLINFSNNTIVLGPKTQIQPVKVWHYKMEVFGFRLDKFAYVTDAKTIEEEEISKLQGVEVLVVNALRKEPHISHFNLEEALDFIQKINPKMAYLTHISHMFGTHEEIEKELPANVRVAYDGLTINF